MPSSLRIRLLRFLVKQTANRVYWLLVTVTIIGLILFIQQQFNGQDIHTLAGRFVKSHVSPVGLLTDWRQCEPVLRQLAWLDIAVDTLLFIPAYFITLTIWCRYVADHSPLTKQTKWPRVRRFVLSFGHRLLVALLVGVVADLVENTIMSGWLLASLTTPPGQWLDWLPGWLMGLIQLVKLVPVGVAFLFILLHPLRIIFSFREAFFRLVGFDWLDRQAPRRVFWLVLTLLFSWLLHFIQSSFNDSHMHALAAQYIDTGVNPVAIINGPPPWLPFRRGLAGLEIAVDTAFIPIYVIMLAVWCRYYRLNSLFVTNPARPSLQRNMQLAGTWIVRLLVVGGLADLVENTILVSWLLGNPGPIPGWGMQVVRILKFFPAGLAAFFILLHPLGIFFSLREAFSHLLGLNRFQQEDVRSALAEHIDNRRRADRQISQELQQLKGEDNSSTNTTLSARRYVFTLWKGFLNVQFVVYLLLFMGGLFQLDQFDELFYFLLTETRGLFVFLWTMLALCLWGGMVYACSKILLFIQPNYFDGINTDDPSQTARTLNSSEGELRLLLNTPLWLSHGPFWLLFITLALNFGRLSSAEQQNADFAFKYAGILIMLLVVYVLFSYVIRRIHKYADKENIPGSSWSFALFKTNVPAKDYALLLDRAPYSILYGQGLLIVLLMLFLPSSTGLWLAREIGLYAVVMCWLAVVAYMGMLVYQFNQLPNYPVAVVLVIAVLLFSRFNDNSAIRQSPKNTTSTSEPDTSAAMRRPNINTYYLRWLVTRKALDSLVADSLQRKLLPTYLSRADSSTTDSLKQVIARADPVLPVVVVATAGGGIRAASWTTEALYALNKAIPNFDRYVFGISGVSGGGVGAATYAATLAGHPDTLQRANCAFLYDSTNLLAPLRNIITEDLISPTAASMLFRGGVHNFSPFPLPNLDRNHWLEDAWEGRLLKPENLPNDSVRGLLTKSFLSLWPTKNSLRNSPLTLPALLLNGAVAETGQKIMMTNLDLGDTHLRDNTFYDVADLFASTGHDVPYKTATFLCARFPFVTSGGRATGALPNITTDCRQTDYHIIDGGYAENTGIVTAVQLIKQLQRVTDASGFRKRMKLRVVYYLLFLPNYAAAEDKGSVNTFRFLAEPVKGFLNTWNRNGVSLDQLISRTLQGSHSALSFDYTSLTLNTTLHRYPLGWYISPRAVERMGEQVRKDIGAEVGDHEKVLQKINWQIGNPR